MAAPPLLAGPGWTAAPLDPARDLAEVAEIWRDAADFLHLATGAMDAEGEARAFFADAPPGRDPASLLKLGFRDPSGRLLGLLEAAPGHPDALTWYLGLLLLSPPHAAGASAAP
ncbi:MAG TPA: hypothetical protein VFR34_05740 [Paracoccaceae bacterium]|nr:hypothetical protein [Paracoccaceae bacterium]